MRTIHTTSLVTLGCLALLAPLAKADAVDSPDEAVMSDHDPEATAQPRHIKALPCRPTIACTAEIVPAGAWEVEAGYAARRASGATNQGGQVLLKYSATNYLQLQLATNNAFAAGSGTQSFMDGGFFGPKIQFNNQGDWMPIISLSAFLQFPTYSTSTLQSTYDALVWTYLSKDIGPIHTDLNLGVNLLNLAASATPQWVTAWSTSADIAYGFGVMTELYGFYGGPATVADAGWLNAISYSPVPEVMFDLGGDVGLAREQRSYTLFVGVTFVPYQTHSKARATQFFVQAPPASAPPVVQTPAPIVAVGSP